MLIAYMLMKAKSKERTNDSSPSLTAILRKFFEESHDRELNSQIVHVDKCASEIHAAKVLIFSCLPCSIFLCILVFSSFDSRNLKSMIDFIKLNSIFLSIFYFEFIIFFSAC